MPEIEDYIEDATDALNDNNWPGYVKELGKELISQNIDRSHRTEFIRELKAAAISQQTKDLSIDALSNQLADIFSIDGRQFRISDLPRARDAIPEIRNWQEGERRLVYLQGMVELESRPEIPDGSIQTLVDVFEQQMELSPLVLEPPISRPKVLVREMGITQAVSREERRRIYKYWEEVGTIKYEAFVKAMEELIENNHKELAEVKEIWNRGKGDKTEEKVEMQEWNYVLLVDDDSKYATVPLKIRRVGQWLRNFIKKIGVEEEEEHRPITGYIPMAEGKEPGPVVGEIDLEDLDETLVSIDGFDSLEVDPILRDLINRDVQRTPFTSHEWISAKKRIKIAGKERLSEIGSGTQLLDYMDSLLDRFEEQVGEVNLDKYYLPINPNIYDPIKVEKIDNQHHELLEALAAFLMKERKVFETPGYFQSTGLSPVAGKYTGKEEYNALLLAFGEYYSEPIFSDLFYDRNNKPRFSAHRSFKELSSIMVDNPFTTKLDMAISNINFEPADLDNVADFLELMKRGAELNFTHNRLDVIRKGHIGLNNVIGDWEENKQLAGHMIYVIAEKSWERVPDEFKTYKGKSIEEWHNDYVSNKDKNQPISLLGEILTSIPFKSKLKIISPEFSRRAAAGAEAKPIIDLKHTEVQEGGRELLATAQRVLEAIEEMHIPFMEIKNSLDLIMYSHDMIRKMLGKKVIYEYRSISNIDDIDYILKQVPKYELTAIEIQTIVNDIDSFNNIAKSVGVDEETVYTIKALCRGV